MLILCMLSHRMRLLQHAADITRASPWSGCCCSMGGRAAPGPGLMPPWAWWGGRLKQRGRGAQPVVVGCPCCCPHWRCVRPWRANSSAGPAAATAGTLHAVSIIITPTLAHFLDQQPEHSTQSTGACSPVGSHPLPLALPFPLFRTRDRRSSPRTLQQKRQGPSADCC